jgi:hypothetical protein
MNFTQLDRRYTLYLMLQISSTVRTLGTALSYLPLVLVAKIRYILYLMLRLGSTAKTVFPSLSLSPDLLDSCAPPSHSLTFLQCRGKQ